MPPGPRTTTEDRPCGAVSAPGRSRGTSFFSWLFSCGSGAAVAPGRRGLSRAPPRSGLPAQPELLDQGAVPGDVLAGQVLQQPAAAAHEEQQPATAVVVMLVHLQVLSQVVDPPGQQCDLDLRRAGVTLIGRVTRDDLRLHGRVERHVAPSSASSSVRYSAWPGSREPGACRDKVRVASRLRAQPTWA